MRYGSLCERRPHQTRATPAYVHGDEFPFKLPLVTAVAEATSRPAGADARAALLSQLAPQPLFVWRAPPRASALKALLFPL